MILKKTWHKRNINVELSAKAKSRDDARNLTYDDFTITFNGSDVTQFLELLPMWQDLIDGIDWEQEYVEAEFDRKTAE